jgi:hypothetical protein
MVQRNKDPLYDTIPVIKFEREVKRRKFDEQFGMLDYFKASEYETLHRFISILERFKGRGAMFYTQGIDTLDEPDKEKERTLGVLPDFLDWFGRRSW